MSSPIVLVTGAPGWLGTRLVESLLRGLPDVPALRDPRGDRVIRCLVQRDADASEVESLSKDKVEIVRGDLAEPASLAPFVRGAEGATLFHAASVIHPTRGTKQFLVINVEGTRHLVEAAATARVKRFVYVSSNSPIGTNRTPDEVFDESAPYRPYMGYGKSKMLAEGIVNAAGADGKLEIVTIRPPWFYGPGQPPRQGLFFSMIKDGKAPLVGSGDNRRSMAYVDNICQGLHLCERVEQAKGQTYWIADRRPYSMNEILDTIERVIERDFKIPVAHKRMRLPGFASSIAWGVDGVLQSLGLYHQKIHVLSEMNKTIACRIDKAERELGYDPKIELEEGMRRSIAWMLARGITL